MPFFPTRSERLDDDDFGSPRRFFRNMFSPIRRLEAYVASLAPGDRLIATILGGLVVAASILGVYGLERLFLVRVPIYGGTLTEGVVGTARFVNPLLAISDTDRDLTALTYAGLMGEGPNGTLVPVLATSYSVSPDGTVYTFKIRPTARFSDGTPVTADDVVYTVEKAQDPALKSPALADWANIRAEAVDASTVRFTLPKPYAPFLEDTTLGILPQNVWKTIDDDGFPFAPQTIQPVGDGPFVVTDVSRSKDGTITSYTLSENKYFALGRPYLDGIRFQFYADTDSVAAALKSGDVESAYGITAKGALEAPYARIFGVFFNAASDPLYARPEVRKALSLAVNRDAIVNGILGGYGVAAIGPLPAGSITSGIAPLPLPDNATRVADAKQVLTDGGWKFDQSDGTWSNGSQTLSVTLRTSNVPELKAIATEIQTDWQAIGVPVSIELYDPNDLTQTVIRPRDYGALLFGEVIDRSTDLYAFWDSSERADPGLNIADYSNPQVDALLEKIRTEDPADAKADIAQVNQLIAADYPAAFTDTPDFLYVVPKDLQGVSLGDIASPTDRFANVWQWYRRTELVWPVFAHHR